MKKNLILFHLVCFMGVAFIVSLFLFYQLFVDQAHRKFSFRSFFNPKVFFTALKKLPAPKEPLNQNALFWQKKSGEITNFENKVILPSSLILPDIQSNIFVVGTQKYLTQLSSTSLTITNVATSQQYSIPLGQDGTFTVLGWFDEQHVVLGKKLDTYSISMVNVETLATEVLVSDITYLGEIPPTSGELLKKVVFPDCTLNCYFIVYDVEKKTQEKKIPAFTDPSHKASLADVKLLFVDQRRQFIGYELPGSKEVYVIDYDLNFLQYIRLENDRNTAEFVNYYPQTQQMLFSLKERNESIQTIALVSANTPSLHVLTKFSTLDQIITSPLAGVYQIKEESYDLNGEPISMDNVVKLLSTY